MLILYGLCDKSGLPGFFAMAAAAIPSLIRVLCGPSAVMGTILAKSASLLFACVMTMKALFLGDRKHMPKGSSENVFLLDYYQNENKPFK